MSKDEQCVYEVLAGSSQESVAETNYQREDTLLKMKMTQTVTSVNEDGSFNVEMHVEHQELTKNGVNVPLDRMQQEVRMRMSKTGEILETSPQVEATQPSFPDRPIVIGENWEAESKMNVQDPITGRPLAPTVLHYYYTLKNVEIMIGYDCAHIEVFIPRSEIRLGGAAQVICGHGDTFFSHTAGRLIKSEVETRVGTRLPDGQLRSSAKVVVQLVTHETAKPAATLQPLDDPSEPS